MKCFNEKITERISRYIPTYCAALILGLAAHMFMLANKICFAGDAGGLFRKGDTIVSGRWGLALSSYIMPDISMPWLNGLMSLLLIGVAVCMTVSIFKIRSRALQILLAGLIVCSPAQTATFCYIYTCAPYALSMVFAVGSVFVFSHGSRFCWILSPLLIVASCSIYQGYFAFAASFCVIILIKELLEKEKTAGQILIHGIQLFAMLVLGVGLYAVSAFSVSAAAGIPVLNIINKSQSILMRIAVAYSAYLKTIIKGYFAYVNSTVSMLMHLVLFALAALCVVCTQKDTPDSKRIGLLLLCLFIFPLSCYCVYLMADNGYIHSLALYPFMSLYVLLAVIFDGFIPEKLCFGSKSAALGMSVIIICNVYFANSLYLFLHLQFEELKSYYTGMMTVVSQTEGFEEGVKLAIAGEEPGLRYDMASNFDFSGFQDPDIDIKNRIHAEGIINSFVGSAVPFASEEEIEEIKKNAEYDEMSVYPYYGSVKRINDCIVVKLGE